MSAATQKTSGLIGLGALLLLACGPALSEEQDAGETDGVSEQAAAPISGELLYSSVCGPCHRPAEFGAIVLAERVDQPVLDQRDDLSADMVEAASRYGIGDMPALTRGELSDAELAAIIDYLTE